MDFYIVIAAALFVYFFPSILAVILRHANPGGIFYVNLAIGWTIIGWFVLFVWVFDREKEG